MTERFAPTRIDWLPNGLRVLTRELHHAPVTTVMVWYGVGSRNEHPGITGVSHFLEHMMFKGTEKFPYGVLEEGVKLRGGMWNAFTSYDYTAYYEVLPARHLAFGLEVEADRMSNMTFDPNLTMRERGIIVSEREGRENSPHFWLQQAFMHEAYRTFPYRHHVLGYKEDIQSTTAESLTSHYQQFYRPNNATLVVTGDFATEQLLELAHLHFGHLPQGNHVAPLAAVEPDQTAERRVLVRRPGPNPSLMLGYSLPAADHPDHPALTILSAILSGGPSFSMGGGGASMGRSSRFYRNLVDTGLAVSAQSGVWSLQYPGLFLCTATPTTGRPLQDIEEAITFQVEGLRQDLVPTQELVRAKKQVRAQFIYGLESGMNQAVMLGGTAMISKVADFDRAVEEFEAVTATDLLRVAQTYLTPSRRTVGWFEPSAQEGAIPAISVRVTGTTQGAVVASETPAHQQRGAQPAPESLGAPPATILDHTQVVRLMLPGDLPLLVYPAPSIPSVFVRIQMEAGAVHDPVGKAGLAQLTALLLTKGSERFTSEELALRTDSLGLSVRVDIGRESAVATLKCLPEDLETGLDLLAEVIQHPTLPDDEIVRIRERLLVSVRRANDDTRTVAARQLTETFFPEPHPYRYPASGTEETLEAIERDDLIAFHHAHYGPRDAVITVVGHVKAEQVEQALIGAFAGWQGGAGRLDVALVTQPKATQTQVTLAAKSQSDIALGWPLVGREHPDYLALDLLATLFGGNGTPASSRLFRDVRERHGVSYYQYASFSGGFGPGAWTAHIGVNPAKLAFTVDLIKAELQRLCEEPIPADELASLKAFLADYPAVQLELPERIAVKLAEMERFGLGLDYLDRYPGLIAALTPDHLQRIARRYLDLNQLTIVTVGPEPSAE